MIGMSWELAGCFLLFQAVQAAVAGALLAALLWYAKRKSPLRGDQT